MEGGLLYKFNHLLDSLRSSNSQDKGNPIAAAKVLTKYLQDSTHTYFTTYAPASLPHIGALAALQQCSTIIMVACCLGTS